MTRKSQMSVTRLRTGLLGLLSIVFLGALVPSSPAEVILQYFNTSYRELAEKMPELVEVGYSALWLPPPTKGSGGLSVGYDLWDPFDLGGKDQRNTVRTRYGTEAELLHLIRVAHRFGVRVYFDNIMNHRAFDVPGYNEYTPIDIYPGMLPEDFHLRVTEEGFYRKWDNIANWSDTWQIQNRNFSDLIDIAQESPDNGNFGTSEGDHIPKLAFVRHPDNPEYYDHNPTNDWVGFGHPSITKQVIADNPDYYREDVNSYLIRAVRWLVHHTKVDGLRLDAVKHVPDYFFGLQSGDKNGSSDGYLGQAQWQFNHTRGFDDWDNHRDSVFDTELTFGRNDLMMFGEHLGEPPSFSGYIDAGMRLVDSQLHGFLNGNLGSPWGTLDGLQYAGGQGFSSGSGVPYVKSHDDDYATRPSLQFALNLTRLGLPNVYTDGNYQSETLGESGGAFPRHANINFLGQWDDNRIPNLVYVHEHFSRGGQQPRWGDADVCAYERVDKRENWGMSDADGTVLFFVMCDNFSSGEYREIDTNFRPGDYLWQYSTGGGNFYYEVPWDQKIKVIIPPGGYFAFSWRSPEESGLWSGGDWDVRPVEIRENGQPVGWVSYVRKDGPDGDPGFNPYGIDDPVSTDFQYRWWVPRVSSATGLDFIVRADGSAENILLKLDGGVDLNGVAHSGGDMRDHPPGNEGSTTVFEGYEQMNYNQRIREKFAAVDTARNIIGTLGAETYECTFGSPGFTINNGDGANSSVDTASWVYHDPTAMTDFPEGEQNSQFWPPPETGSVDTVYMWVKMGYATEADKMYVYYTTTGGDDYPEGSGGYPLNDSTFVSELNYSTNGPLDDGKDTDWWTGTLPAMSSGTTLRYKIGCYHHDAGSRFPINSDEVYWKKRMVSQFSITNFNAGGVELYPHMDFAQDTKQTGLDEGFHVLRARAFLNRSSSSSIYNTYVQPFYYDAVAPTGVVVYPSHGETLWNNQYGAVVRTDWTVTDVYFNIDDVNPDNDDGSTGRDLGNGTNAQGEVSWVAVSEVDASLSLNTNYPALPREWRFNYSNVPTNSPATIRVKLAELSSSTNVLLSDVEGRFRTLERQVTANGPDFGMYIAYPQQDGDTVGVGYEMKTWFSPALWTGEQPDTIRDRFLITIDGEAQGRDAYQLYWMGSDDNSMHEMIYALPDLYNGDDNFLHHIVVTHTNAAGGGVQLMADRYVKSWPTVAGPHIDIVTPPEYDSDGKKFEIILADNCVSGGGDREYTIKVETDLAAQHVWLEFPNDTVTVTPYDSTTNALTGTVSVWNGSNRVEGAGVALTGWVSATYSNTTVTGSNTSFTTELEVGNRLQIDTNVVTVASISNNTELTISNPYPGSNTNDVAAMIMPAFDTELSVGSTLMIGSQVMTVTGILSSSNCIVTPAYPNGTASGLTAYRIDGNPQTVGDKRNWLFLWEDVEAGNYWFGAHCNTNEASDATISASTWRNTTVIFREMVETNSTLDWDDDGLFNGAETIPTNLPPTNAETWNNGDVHIWRVYGRTDPLRPDTDGDGLPDGLESGWRNADLGETSTNEDTNCDGFANFLPDYDPPFFNTVPDNSGLPEYVFYASRTDQIHGTLTDPNNPDSDYDGIKDGVEDANRNGWVDGDGNPLQPATSNPWDDRPTEGDWPDGDWDSAWTETDPNNSDTDGDDASDGYGEDVNYNGWIDGDTDSNRTWTVGELWEESDPLNPDTDGDGLPDGWERRYDFDALDRGVTGAIHMGTGLVITNLEHGANGNPDGDLIVVQGQTNDYVNYLELQNGTHPRQANSLDPPPEGSIIIGPGDPIGTVNGTTNFQEFMDWTWDDLLVLDEYEGGGPNNQLGDVYKGWDGWDESRDIVAFYAHDGGDIGSGDGNFYFRLDFYDLRATAEEGNLDIYIVIDTGNTDQGEKALPDDVDAETRMGWEVVVAVYQSGQGTVYVDTNPSNNSIEVGQDLGAFGVESRGPGSVGGFIDAYYNAELDAMECSISRQALTDAGWSGSGASNFSYQVYTTKDGTSNSPVGDGDIGGRNDIRDSIYDDKIAEDYYFDQGSIDDILYSWFRGTDRTGRAKVATLVHGNQAIKPGNQVQDLINTGSGAGYHRPLVVHEVFGQPLNLHITATLASAIQWASVDPAAGKPWADGPALNAKIAELIDTNVVHLLGSTFSDHMLPYFTHAYNRDNEALAREYLERIYDTTIDQSTAVFWPPERLLDYDVFGKIRDMGYTFTLCDQDTHLFNWIGRTESLVDSAYRINEFRKAGEPGGWAGRCFVINNLATSYRFNNTDSGLDIALRSLLNRKARSGINDQVITLLSSWSDFTDNSDADAYDRNIRWLANRPWTPIVAYEQITRGEVDATRDGVGDPFDAGWFAEWRDENVAISNKQSYNWLNHATQENFNHWYVGQSGVEEGLQEKMFDIRPGTQLTNRYGMLYFSNSIVQDAWIAVDSVSQSNLSELARATLHASVFQTAFHDETNHDTRRYSTGQYLYPATGYNPLAAFAQNAQSQSRLAAIYKHVDDWSALADSVVTPQAIAQDVDLDGENEYLLYNDRLFACFEAVGGRLVGAWIKDVLDDSVYQAMGNFVGYSGTNVEFEGESNVYDDGSVQAYRTSGLKDWWDGSQNYVNPLYTVTPVALGWQFTSPDTTISKTVTLAARERKLEVSYTTSGKTVFVRHGLSPDLADLLKDGQGMLTTVQDSGGVLRLSNTNYGTTVEAIIGYADAGHNASWQSTASDEDTNKVDFATVPMRNQAQTHQVEIHGANSFSFSLGFDAQPSDWDGDGIPNTYEDGAYYLSSSNGLDGALDKDGDGVINSDEWISNTDPDDITDYLRLTDADGVTTGFVVRFPAKPDRVYNISYDNDLIAAPGWSNATPTPITVPTEQIYTWVDDGATTTPHPTNTPHRFYDVGVRLP